MYRNPFILHDNSGNNAFSYDIREKKTLFVPSLIEGTLDDVRVGSEVVFADIGEDGRLQECIGLEHFVKTTWCEHHPELVSESPHIVPMYIFDNHNHAFYFWHEARESGVIQDGATLIHIDEHSDLREPAMSLEDFLSKQSLIIPNTPSVIPSVVEGSLQYREKSDSSTRFAWSEGQPIQLETRNSKLETIFHYTNKILQVGDYIRPAEATGLIEKTHCILTEGQLLEYKNIPLSENLILNLDLDFFEPRLDDISFELKKNAVLHFARKAKLITVATSPFFIEQSLAIRVLRRLFLEG